MKNYELSPSTFDEPMKTISIEQAKKEDIKWINSKYSEVNFINSNFQNEFIVVAKIENQKAGIGRLVIINKKNIELGGIYVFPNFRRLGVAEKIVDYLITNNPFNNSIIWCLPFENLLNFYLKFNFKLITLESKIPDELIKKYKWCNSNIQYSEKVLILRKISK